jgi:Subtilase family/MBG domain
MRPRAPLFAVLVSMVFVCPLIAQERLADLLSDPAVRLSRPVDRARVVARLRESETKRRQAARDRATLRGLPLRMVSPSGRIQEIADFDGDSPVYLTTQNVNAAISTSANLLRTSPYSLTGAGVTIGLWDGGSSRSTHQEFGGRITVMDGSSSIDHATHVGGTLIASGVDPAARGMASSASIKSYDWNSDTVEMAASGATTAGDPDKIYLSNHSYGYVSGWNYVGNATRAWEWHGAGTGSAAIEDDFGRYNDLARDSDALAFNAPYYLIFRSAGNDRIDNPAPGQNVSLSPGGAAVAYSYSMHPAGDGNYRGGFETIGYNALAKNVITVGSATDAVTGGLRAPGVALVNSFSSWGPTDDGRIKPDIVANGDTVYSSLNGSDTSYGVYNGTSMATPNAAGSAALLVQQFSGLFPGQAMRSSTLKGLLVHTADDLGNAGPDYKFGWGLVNVQSAADLIRDHSEFPVKQRITESELTSTITTRTHSFVWDGVSPVSATLCWTDPAGTSTTTSDSRSARLVNNLNLKITAPNGADALPFVMPFVGAWTQASMDLPATTGINNTDNVEQVRIAAPPVAGVYQATVSFSGSLANNSQNYSLLLSGASATPPPLVVSAVTPDSALPATVTFDLTGTGLRADTAVRLTRYGQSDIFASGVQMIGEKLRCQVDLTGAAPGVWDVVVANPDSETFTLAGGFVVVGTLWSESFDGAVSGWNSQATTGSNSWSLVTTPGQSPAKSYFAPGPSNKTTTRLTSPTIPVSPAASKLQLRIWHSYNLQSTRDAGKLELSTNSGSTWFDVESNGSGASFASNGYNSTISTSGTSSTRNEFAGQRAWSGNSNGPVETVVNLTDTAKFAGKNLRIRWRIATNGSTSSPGWYLDNVVLLGNTVVPNQPPAITSAATSTSAESIIDQGNTYQIIRAASASLAVAASDDGGEPALTYTWAASGMPPHPVLFSPNVTNAAQSTTATFDGPGDYQIAVTARDAEGLTTVSNVRLRVLQTATGLVVSPATAILPVGSTQQFGATLLDQFGLAMASQPTSFDWETSGGGTINPAGLFTAVSVGGHLITARDGGISNTAGVTVIPGVASIVLGSLNQTYDGTPKPVTATTNPPGLSVAITYDNQSVIPTNVNSYAVEATITDINYQGSASDTLAIEKAAASVDLTNLAQTYDGTPKSITSTTTPENLPVSLTYNGASTPPTDAGTYTVVASVDAPNHQGSATQSLVIEKATATLELTDLAQTYDGTPKSITATTTPENLPVSLTYNGASTPPTDAGTYTVVATIDAPNHQGTATQSLVIEKATTSIALTSLAQTYDGSPKPVIALTTPENLAVSISYNGAPTPPVEAGTYTVTAVVNDINRQGSASDTLVITPGNDFVSWQNIHFDESEQTEGLADDLADPDGDNQPNLTEYALGSDPRKFTPQPVPTRDLDGLSFTFTRPANLPGITYEVESSEDMAVWRPALLELVTPGPTEALRARDPLDTGNPAQRFLRLRISRP